MGSLKKWIINKFLPAWCREKLLEENSRLRGSVLELKQENAVLRAHISGMERGLKLSRKITIRGDRVEYLGSIDKQR